MKNMLMIARREMRRQHPDTCQIDAPIGFVPALHLPRERRTVASSFRNELGSRERRTDAPSASGTKNAHHFSPERVESAGPHRHARGRGEREGRAKNVSSAFATVFREGTWRRRATTRMAPRSKPVLCRFRLTRQLCIRLRCGLRALDIRKPANLTNDMPRPERMVAGDSGTPREFDGMPREAFRSVHYLMRLAASTSAAKSADSSTSTWQVRK